MSVDNEFDMNAAAEAVSAGLDFGDESLEVLPEEVSTETSSENAAETATEAAEVLPEATSSVTKEPSPWVPPEAHKHLFNDKGLLATWRPEAAAEFASLSPRVQEEIIKREEDIIKGIDGYKASAAFGDSFRRTLEPYMETLQRLKIDPAEQTGRLMQAQYTLAFGSPEQKGQLLLQIAQDYQIDLSSLAVSQPFVDPQVQDLQNQIREVQSQLSNAQRLQAQASRAELQRTVEAFAQDPANQFFDDVSGEMEMLLKSGAAKDLKEAYEKAIWLNPAIREKELARRQAEKAEAQRKADVEKVEKARKASAANVQTAAKGGSAATPLGSMDDTLAETLAAIRSR